MKATSPISKLLYCVLVAQMALALLMLIAPFGFDHRSSWGLDFDHFMRGMALLAGLSVAAVSLSIWTKNWVALTASIAAILIGLLKIAIA